MHVTILYHSLYFSCLIFLNYHLFIFLNRPANLWQKPANFELKAANFEQEPAKLTTQPAGFVHEKREVTLLGYAAPF
jgi:hypothetical protein